MRVLVTMVFLLVSGAAFAQDPAATTPTVLPEASHSVQALWQAPDTGFTDKPSYVSNCAGDLTGEVRAKLIPELQAACLRLKELEIEKLKADAELARLKMQTTSEFIGALQGYHVSETGRVVTTNGSVNGTSTFFDGQNQIVATGGAAVGYVMFAGNEGGQQGMQNGLGAVGMYQNVRDIRAALAGQVISGVSATTTPDGDKPKLPTTPPADNTAALEKTRAVIAAQGAEIEALQAKIKTLQGS